MLELIYRLLKKQKTGFKFKRLAAGESFELKPGMLCIISPAGKSLGIYNGNGTRIAEKDAGTTIAFCCDLGEGEASGTDFRAIFAYANEFSILDISNILGISQVTCKEGAYILNNGTGSANVYYMTRG